MGCLEAASGWLTPSMRGQPKRRLCEVNSWAFNPRPFPKTILKVEEVTVAFGGFKAMNDLNLSLERGELRVVIGPNGAGKTTLLDVITGKTRPRSGKVWFQPDERPRMDITGLPEQPIARLGIGRKFQTPNVFKSLTVLENLRLSLKYPRGVLATLTAPFRQNGQVRIEEILQTIGLAPRRTAPPASWPTARSSGWSWAC